MFTVPQKRLQSKRFREKIRVLQGRWYVNDLEFSLLYTLPDTVVSDVGVFRVGSSETNIHQNMQSRAPVEHLGCMRIAGDGTYTEINVGSGLVSKPH